MDINRFGIGFGVLLAVFGFVLVSQIIGGIVHRSNSPKARHFVTGVGILLAILVLSYWIGGLFTR